MKIPHTKIVQGGAHMSLKSRLVSEFDRFIYLFIYVMYRDPCIHVSPPLEVVSGVSVFFIRFVFTPSYNKESTSIALR